MTSIPLDYADRVYAGWLGKCIGVRFGAPLEGWTYEEIRDNVGELESYLREDLDKIFKPDDDTSLPMVLIRAMEDYGVSPELTAEQIGETWLNYLGDQHGTLWWGGYGVSTEHTAYLNLSSGIPAPRSGSIAQNGAAVAEQIGGQIFSDIWGLIAPNNPTLAADLAERASSVSHDGNGTYGGRFIAGLVSAAFSESEPSKLIETGLSLIPADSEYARVIQAMVDFQRQRQDDWRAAFAHLKANFGYDRYPGQVHIIPNAGVIALALLYGNGEFSRTIQIANMCGWDTDCNVGNVGAILGVAAGVDGIDSHWREPMNDLLITAGIIGTRNLLTIPQCADLFCRIGLMLAGQVPANRPRIHFSYPNSTQNFEARGNRGRTIELRHSTRYGDALQVSIRKLNKKGEVRLFTRTYYRPSELSGNFYQANLSPLIYPGQTIRARVCIPDDAPDSIQASLYVYDENHVMSYQSTGEALRPGEWHLLTYTIPPLTDICFSEVGIVVRNTGAEWTTGAFYLSEMDWYGAPDYRLTFARERLESGVISQWTWHRGFWRLDNGAYHGSGPGICETYTGDINWTDYTLQAELIPIIGEHHLINTRVQGALRSYAFGLAPNGCVALYKKSKHYRQVASADFAWKVGEQYILSLRAEQGHLIATVEGGGNTQTIDWFDKDSPYLSGQVGLSTWHGSHTRYVSLQVSGVEHGTPA